MESYIQISFLNDFIFCPRSIYFHQLFGKISTIIYHTECQIKGRAIHEAIDDKRYSSRKNILQGISVYSEKYRICGKIDIYDMGSKILIERKKHIKKVYDGYIFQLYAQYYGLIEMGHHVEEMYLYSSDTNKKFSISLPDEDVDMFTKFENLIYDMNHFNLSSFKQTNADKCGHCVYSSLCDQSLC